MTKGKKALFITLLVLTVVLSGAAIFIGYRLSEEEDVTPEPSKAGDTGIECPSDWYGQTHCNTDSGSSYYCHDMYCDSNTGNWDDRGECGSECDNHPDCSAVCGDDSTTTTSTSSTTCSCGWNGSAGNRCCLTTSNCTAPTCTHEIIWEVDDPTSVCPNGGMLFCGSGGPECRSNLCSCDYSCNANEYKCDCSTAGARRATGSCADCNNDYIGCCCAQDTTTTTSQATTTTVTTTTSLTTTSTTTSVTTTTSSSSTTSLTTTTTTPTTTSLTTGVTTLPSNAIFSPVKDKLLLSFILLIGGSVLYMFNIVEKLLNPMIDFVNKHKSFKKSFMKISEPIINLTDRLKGNSKKDIRKKKFEKEIVKDK